MHCPICKETTFIISPWAIKPEKGDYWLMNDTCGSEEHWHNLTMVMPKIEYKLLDPPRPWPYGSFMEFTQEMSIEEAKKRWPKEMIEDKE